MIATMFVGVLLAMVFLSAALILALLPAACLIAVVRTPFATFRAAGSNKILWVILLIWLNLFAGVVYLAAVRPRLEAANTFSQRCQMTPL